MKTVGRSAVRATLVAIALFAGVLVTVFSHRLLLRWSDIGLAAGNLPRLVQAINGLVAVGLVLVLAWKVWYRYAARVLAGSLTALAFSSANPGIALVFDGAPFRVLYGLAAGAWLVALAGLIRFSQVFPAPVPAIERSTRGGLRGVGRALAAGAASPKLPQVVAGFAIVVTGLLLIEGVAGRLFNAVWAAMEELAVIAVLVMAVNLRVNYQPGTKEARRRVFWVVGGFVVGAVILLLSAGLTIIEMVTGLSIPVPYWQFLLWDIALLAVLACLGIAIFYSGAFDPRLVIRTTAVYGLVVFLLTVLFAGVETLVEALVAPLVGLSEGMGAWIASAAVALSLGPLYAWISGRVKKLAPSSNDGEAEPAVTDPTQ